MSKISYGNFTEEFVFELSKYLEGKRVLEVFGGNGLLASKLSVKGVDIKCTTVFSGHDGHQSGVYHDIEELSALAAVQKYRDYDVLLMSWPVATNAAAIAALGWQVGKPIVFIGEVTDYERGMLGGCASDVFFDLTEETAVFESYHPRNMLDRAAVRIVTHDRIDKALRELRNNRDPLKHSGISEAAFELTL